jgi:hypothetical protein
VLSEVTSAAALVVAGGAVVVGLLALLGTGRLSAALPLTLELLTAAGLLRLAADQTWAAILGAALIVLLRQLLAAALRRGAGVAWRWPAPRAAAGQGPPRTPG